MVFDNISDEFMIWVTIAILAVFSLQHFSPNFLDPILEFDLFGVMRVITGLRILAIVSIVKMWRRQI